MLLWIKPGGLEDEIERFGDNRSSVAPIKEAANGEVYTLAEEFGPWKNAFLCDFLFDFGEVRWEQGQWWEAAIIEKKDEEENV